MKIRERILNNLLGFCSEFENYVKCAENKRSDKKRKAYGAMEFHATRLGEIFGDKRLRDIEYRLSQTVVASMDVCMNGLRGVTLETIMTERGLAYLKYCIGTVEGARGLCSGIYIPPKDEIERRGDESIQRFGALAGFLRDSIYPLAMGQCEDLIPDTLVERNWGDNYLAKLVKTFPWAFGHTNQFKKFQTRKLDNKTRERYIDYVRASAPRLIRMIQRTLESSEKHSGLLQMERGFAIQLGVAIKNQEVLEGDFLEMITLPMNGIWYSLNLYNQTVDVQEAKKRLCRRRGSKVFDEL
jgi:hypothetical protein